MRRKMELISLLAVCLWKLWEYERKNFGREIDLEEWLNTWELPRKEILTCSSKAKLKFSIVELLIIYAIIKN